MVVRNLSKVGYSKSGTGHSFNYILMVPHGEEGEAKKGWNLLMR